MFEVSCDDGGDGNQRHGDDDSTSEQIKHQPSPENDNAPAAACDGKESKPDKRPVDQHNITPDAAHRESTTISTSSNAVEDPEQTQDGQNRQESAPGVCFVPGPDFVSNVASNSNEPAPPKPITETSPPVDNVNIMISDAIAVEVDHAVQAETIKTVKFRGKEMHSSSFKCLVCSVLTVAAAVVIIPTAMHFGFFPSEGSVGSSTSTSKLGEWEECTDSTQCNNQCCSSKYSDGVLKCTPVEFKPSEGCVGSSTSTSNLGEWEKCTESTQCNNQCCSSKYSDGVLKCTPVEFKPSEGCVGSSTSTSNLGEWGWEGSVGSSTSTSNIPTMEPTSNPTPIPTATASKIPTSKLGEWEKCTDSTQCNNQCCSSKYSDGVLKCTPVEFKPSEGCVGSSTSTSNLGEWGWQGSVGSSTSTSNIPTMEPTSNPTPIPTATASKIPTSKLGEWEKCTDSTQCNNQCCSSKYSLGILKCTSVGGFFPSEGCVGSSTSNLGEWEKCTDSTQCNNQCCSSKYSDGVLKCTPVKFKPSGGCVGSATRHLRGNNEDEVLNADETITTFMHYAAQVEELGRGVEYGDELN